MEFCDTKKVVCVFFIPVPALTGSIWKNLGIELAQSCDDRTQKGKFLRRCTPPGGTDEEGQACLSVDYHACRLCSNISWVSVSIINIPSLKVSSWATSCPSGFQIEDLPAQSYPPDSPTQLASSTVIEYVFAISESLLLALSIPGSFRWKR